MLARVSSWDILTSFVAIPAGNALAGPLAHTYGTGRVILVAAVVMALASFAPMLRPGLAGPVRPGHPRLAGTDPARRPGRPARRRAVGPARRGSWRPGSTMRLVGGSQRDELVDAEPGVDPHRWARSWRMAGR